MIGFGSTASYEEEENGSFSGIRYREEYTAPYQMTLYVTKNLVLFGGLLVRSHAEPGLHEVADVAV